MKQAIESFIKSKNISLNSQKSYTYDLQQFLTVTKGEISQQSTDLSTVSLGPETCCSEKKSINYQSISLFPL